MVLNCNGYGSNLRISFDLKPFSKFVPLLAAALSKIQYASTFIYGSSARFNMPLCFSDIDIFVILSNKSRDNVLISSFKRFNLLGFSSKYIKNKIMERSDDGSFFRTVFLQPKVFVDGSIDEVWDFVCLSKKYFDEKDLTLLIKHEMKKIIVGKRRFLFGEKYVGASLQYLARFMKPSEFFYLNFDDKLCETSLNILRKTIFYE